MMRTLGQNSKPVFLSEYGIGSMMDVIHEARMYQQAGIPEDAEDFVLMRSMADRFAADWSRFAMETAYPYPETLLEMSQRSMAHHRLLGFNLIRSNPKICGFNLNGNAGPRHDRRRTLAILARLETWCLRCCLRRLGARTVVPVR